MRSLDSIWYIVCTSVLYVGQHHLERYYGRGATREVQARQGLRFGFFSSPQAGR